MSIDVFYLFIYFLIKYRYFWLLYKISLLVAVFYHTFTQCSQEIKKQTKECITNANSKTAEEVRGVSIPGSMRSRSKMNSIVTGITSMPLIQVILKDVTIATATSKTNNAWVLSVHETLDRKCS